MGSKIKNKQVRQSLHAKDKAAKKNRKLERRLALKQEEEADPSLRAARLAANVPRTIEATREWVGDGYGAGSGGKEPREGQAKDRRTLPVQLVEDGEGGQKLDLAGLEDLFPDEEPSRMVDEVSPEASTSAVTLDTETPGAGRVLLTTSPKPSEETVELLEDLKNMLGGQTRAQIVPRKTTRFELSKISRWATKRGYSALVVVGEDNDLPASITVSKLPTGPTAHFRLTSVELNKQIQGHGAPTGHTPELVLSNMFTPLGLSIGRLLGTLFPPTPQFEGRQVVAVHNQRDFLFIRRFRYMFVLRSTDEDAQKKAEERGMDADVKTRMQELGPRMTLKLRWLKRGTLSDGRRKANNGVAGEQEAAKETEIPDNDLEEAQIDQSVVDEAVAEAASGAQEPDAMEEDAAERPAKKKAPRRKTTHSRSSGDLMIPRLKPTPEAVPTTGDLALRRRKPKKGASVLDSMNLQGGMLDSRKEWNWDPRMQVSKRKFFM